MGIDVEPGGVCQTDREIKTRVELLLLTAVEINLVAKTTNRITHKCIEQGVHWK